MDITVYTGVIAACCTTISFLPQAVKVIMTKDTAAISTGMYSLFTFGTLMWLIYGIVSHNMPIIIANAVTLVFACVILYCKLFYGNGVWLVTSHPDLDKP
jgi:MtN3 and saliva related transmembrane protein